MRSISPKSSPPSKQPRPQPKQPESKQTKALEQVVKRLQESVDKLSSNLEEDKASKRQDQRRQQSQSHHQPQKRPSLESILTWRDIDSEADAAEIYNAASAALSTTEVREGILSGDKSLLGGFQREIIKELTDPGSLFDKQELALAHRLIEVIRERIHDGVTYGEDQRKAQDRVIKEAKQEPSQHADGDDDDSPMEVDEDDVDQSAD